MIEWRCQFAATTTHFSLGDYLGERSIFFRETGKWFRGIKDNRKIEIERRKERDVGDRAETRRIRTNRSQEENDEVAGRSEEGRHDEKSGTGPGTLEKPSMAVGRGWNEERWQVGSQSIYREEEQRKRERKECMMEKKRTGGVGGKSRDFSKTGSGARDAALIISNGPRASYIAFFFYPRPHLRIVSSDRRPQWFIFAPAIPREWAKKRTRESRCHAAFAERKGGSADTSATTTVGEDP